MRLKVGDRVQGRDSDQDRWVKGTVKDIVDGRPRVQVDGKDEACTWEQVQPLVIAKAATPSFHYERLIVSLPQLRFAFASCSSSVHKLTRKHLKIFMAPLS